MRSGSRRAAARALWAAVAALAVLAAAVPAQGAPPPPGSDTDPHNPGLVYRTVYTRLASAQSAELDVACPAGHRPFGGSVEVLGATHQVIIQRSEPVYSATENGFFAAAVERVGLYGGDYTGSWQLRVTAVCGPAYPNLSYVRVTSASSGTDTKTVQAVCPTGRTRIGMGGAIHTTSRAVRFDFLGFGIFTTPYASYPSVADSVRVIAGEVPFGTGTAWSLTSVVVCATPPSDVYFWGYQAGYGIDVENGQYVYHDESIDEPCGGWSPDNHSYVTGVGGGQDGDSGEVNLEWYIDGDDREIGGMRRRLDPGGYSGAPMSSYFSLVCVTKV
jgi:hypothetical protein